ncbi:MAG TPA: hypothetical protein VNT60_11305 [Deinococcales bacterium]|nr:hypothetical protein [Deinococcales bacterium]
MVEINLLPRELKRRTGPDYFRLAYTVLPALALTVMAVLQVGANAENARLQAEKEDLQLEVELLRPYVRDQAILNGQRAQLTKIAAVDTALRGGNKAWSGDISRFTSLLQASGARVALVGLQASPFNQPAEGAKENPYPARYVTRELLLTGQAAAVSDIVRFVRTFEARTDYGIQLGSFQLTATEPRVYTFNARVGIVGEPPPPKTEEKGKSGSDDAK